MRVRGDLHTNTISPVSVRTLLRQFGQLYLKGLWDVMFAHRSIIPEWAQLLNPICSFRMERQTQSSCQNCSVLSSCSSIHDRLIWFFILKDFFPSLSDLGQRGYALVCQHKAEAQAQTERAQRSNRSLGKNHRIFLQTHYTNDSVSVQRASV